LKQPPPSYGITDLFFSIQYCTEYLLKLVHSLDADTIDVKLEMDTIYGVSFTEYAIVLETLLVNKKNPPRKG